MGKAVKVKPIGNADITERYIRLIEKQTGKAVRPYRTDGYVNLMNRYGTSKDTSEHYYFQPEPIVSDDILSMFYEGNGLFSKIIDTPAEEALKHGFTLDGVSDQSVTDFAYEALDELDWEETAMTAIKWARLFGGSIAILLINDGRGLEEPLDWKSIKSIDDIRIYDRSVIQPDYSSMFSYDPTDPFGTRGSRLGMPERYHISSRYGSFTVHDSRCLVFQNGILPENCSNSVYQLWGMPEYVRIHKSIRNAELAHESVTKMLDKTVQPIYKVKNLASELSTEDGENTLLRRLQAIDLARGVLNSVAIDAEGEDYDFKTFQFSGVADTIDAACNFLSALTSIPQTILFGRSPAGMNSTGRADLENYYNYVERIQKRMLRSNLRYLLSVIFQAGMYTGEIEEVPTIKVTFNPLWSLTEKEQTELEQQKAALQQTKAQTVQTYVDMGVIDPSEVRQKLAGSEEFNAETMLDDYSEDELFENMPQQEEQQEQQQAPQEQGNVAEPQGKIFEQGDFNKYIKGNSPDAAPEATKLPQDMSKDKKIIENDGGDGSGNWGHEGVEGQIGGSAPGGGNHNRMMSTKGGYTSFSKEKKRFATPHRPTFDEIAKCPNHSKIVVKNVVNNEKIIFEKNSNGFCSSTYGQMDEMSFAQVVCGGRNYTTSIYIPDSADISYLARTETYSSERKAAAPRKESPETIDSMLRDKTGKIWEEADEHTKDTLFAYTSYMFGDINETLRDCNDYEEFCQYKEVKESTDAITSAISKSKLEKDMWLTRGVDKEGAAAFLGISQGAITGSEDFNPNSLVGKTVTDKAFMSCGSTQGTGFTDKKVNYSIFCPAGTEALYAEPFSMAGEGDKRYWNGKDKQSKLGDELETILQRGTSCMITKAYRGKDGTLNVEMEVVAQNYEK